MQNTSSPVLSYILLAAVVAMSVLRRRSLALTEAGSLLKGERQRLTLITVFDPFLGLLVVGPVLWHLMSRDLTHVVAFLVGAGVALPFGVARANAMYVRAVPSAKSVVLRRSTIEYGLLGVLIALRLAESLVERIHAPFIGSVLTAMISLAVVESFVRAGVIVQRYRSEVALAPQA